MGQAIVKADLSQVRNSIDLWITEKSFTLISSSDNSNKSVIVSQNGKLKTRWSNTYKDDEIIVSMNLSLRPYLSAFIHLSEISALSLTLLLINGLLDEFTFGKMVIFLAAVFPLMLLFWWHTYRLPRRLDKLEKSFWSDLGKDYDLTQIKRYEGHLISSKYLLLKETLLSFLLIILCGLLLGAIASLTAIVLSAAIISLNALRQIANRSRQSHWRFWVIENIYSWFTVILALLGLLIGLSTIEIILPLEKNISRPGEILRAFHFREVSPADSESLESDCRKVMFSTLENQSNETISEELFRKFTLFYSISIMTLLTVALYFFSYRPLKLIFRKADSWKYSTDMSDQTVVPTVPYLSGSENTNTPISFYISAGIFYIMGCAINWLASILCIDAFGYAFSGHAVFIEKSANVWSWIFVFNKTIFGNLAGHIVSVLFLTVMFMPVLLVFASLLKRTVSKLSIYVRFIFNRYKTTDRKAAQINEFIKTLDEKTILSVTNAPFAATHARTLLLSKIHVIEISRRAFDLLDTEELKAIVCHELGHIKHDIRKVELLKLLSSLALFPNYFLTLCINWPKYETDADKFAIEQIKNPTALKIALIKISSATLEYCNKKGSSGKPSAKYNTLKRSMSFFFGKGLLGYSHPHLSHRLKLIDSYTMKAES